MVVVSKDKVEINISRRRFEDEATKSGVDDEKATWVNSLLSSKILCFI